MGYHSQKTDVEYLSATGCRRIFNMAYNGNECSMEFVAPACLIFYGLALVNGSKYTMGEVRWLGYGEIVLGIINLWIPGQDLFSGRSVLDCFI